MRHLALALLLFAAPAHAGSVAMMCGGGVTAATENMCADGDSARLCETFDATGYDNAWTEGGVADSSTINEDAAHALTFYCDTSTEMLTIHREGTETLTDSVSFDESTTLYSNFRFIVNTESVTAGMDWIYVYDGVGVKWQVAIRDDGANNLFLRITHRNNANSNVADDSTTFSTAAWHLLEVKWIGNQASDGFSVTLDGSAVTIADTGTASSAYSLDKLEFRASGVNIDYSIDNIKLHTSAPTCN